MFALVVVALTFSLSILVSHFILAKFHEANESVGGQQIINSTLMSKATTGFKIMSAGTILIIVLVGIIAVAYAYQVETNPVMLGIAVLVFIFAIGLSAFYSNVFHIMATQTEMNTTANYHPTMVSVMEHLPKIVTVFGLLVLIALYSRTRGGTFG